jgi:hypothetical protein
VTLFSLLVLAHLLYDFHWQGPFIAEMKGKSWFILGVHALTWALLLCAVLWARGSLVPWHLPFLFITHFGTDAWKSRQPKTPETWNLIYVDQGIHLLTLVAVALA